MKLGPRDLEAIRSNARRGGYVRPNQVLQMLLDMEELREQVGHLRGQLQLADLGAHAGAQSQVALSAVLVRLQDHVRQLEGAAVEASSRPSVRNMLLGQAKGAKTAIGYIRDEFHVTDEHQCETCPDCIHDGQKCCGCYDGVCCQSADVVDDGVGGSSR